MLRICSTFFRVGVCHGCTVSARGAFPSPPPDAERRVRAGACGARRRCVLRNGPPHRCAFLPRPAPRGIPNDGKSRARRFGTANIVRFWILSYGKLTLGRIPWRLAATYSSVAAAGEACVRSGRSSRAGNHRALRRPSRCACGCCSKGRRDQHLRGRRPAAKRVRLPGGVQLICTAASVRPIW